MAACTIRLEGRELPVDYFGVALVAVGALKIAAVVLWFVWQSGMPVIGRRPSVRNMAQAAILRCVEVRRILARGNGAIVTR
jgi:hypothetical protein